MYWFSTDRVWPTRGASGSLPISGLLDLPSIGCAKTRLIGRYSEPGPKRGSFSYLRDRGRIIGAALRTRERVAPVFVSVGHRVSLKDSLQIVLGCCAGFRLPETTRCVDRLARAAAGMTADGRVK